MVALDSKTKVLIVGSGLSGLALAQILRNKHVEFEIFERDNGTRPQGWTIALDECLQGLYRLLPKDIPDLATCSPNFALNKIDTFTIMDGTTHQVLGVTTTKHLGEKSLSIFANRLNFREALHTHINVQYSKQFVRYEEGEHGVEVFFKDGTSARGDVLVGADGANSPVRSQLLPGFKPDPSPYLTALGRITLSREMYEPLLKHSSNGPLVGAPNQKGYCLLMKYFDDETAAFNWDVAWRTENVEEGYAEMAAAGPAAQLETVKQLVVNWPPEMAKAVNLSKEEDLQWPPVRLLETVLPPRGLPKGRVTLVGDAAHSMVPFRGMGGNTALLDACDLGEGLTEGVQAKKDLHWVLQKYEEVMIPRGRGKVLESRETANSEDAAEVSGGRLSKTEPAPVPVSV